MTPPSTSYPIKQIILGLVLQGKKYGYEIHKEICDPTGLGMIWNLRQSQMYKILKSICAEGLLSEIKLEVVKGRHKRIFEITSQGAKIFDEWIRSPVNYPRNFLQEFLPKYYFIIKNEFINPNEIIQIQSNKVNDWSDHLHDQLTHCNGEFQKKIILFKIYRIDAIKEWMNKELI